MVNLPPSLSGAPIAALAVSKDQNMEAAEELVLKLCIPELREKALLDLSKKRETCPNLAQLLWQSFGTITALLKEIVSIYRSLSPPTLSSDQSNRVCNALALLQCVATNADIRPLFLAAQIPRYLYPFLNSQNRAKEYESLRLTSLGVIRALVKDDDHEVVLFLLTSEIIPLCLRTMEIGSELSKTEATYIFQKILADDSGLHYVCATADRFFAIISMLALMVESAKQPSPKLLRQIIGCYLRLTDNARACSLLHRYLPLSLTNGTWNKYPQGDLEIQWLRQLICNVNITSRGGAHTGLDHRMGM